MYDREFIKKRRIRRIAAIAALGSATVITSLVIISMLGRYSGTFTVALKNSEVSLSLSETKDFKKSGTFLRLEGLKDFEEASYDKDIKGANLDDEHIAWDNGGIKRDGEMIGMKYLKYTFYVRNSGDKTAQYNMSINFEQRSKSTDGSERGLDDTLRIMLYENDVIDGQPDSHENVFIYAKAAATNNYTADNEPTSLEFVSKHSYDFKASEQYPLVDASFEDSRVAAKRSVPAFEKGDMKRYTLVAWLEGDDPQSNNSEASPKGASLKLGIEITAYQK